MTRLPAVAMAGLQIAGLWAISGLAHQLVAWLHLPLPGNVMGLLLTFAVLATKMVPIAALERGGAVLLKHMSLLFVPYAAGIGRLYPLIAAHGLAIGTVLLVSAVLGYAVTGRVTQAALGWTAAPQLRPVASHG